VQGFAGAGVDKVCGIEARGFILGAPVAYCLGAGFIPIRKLGKLPGTTLSESYTLEYAQAVLEIHDDAVVPGDRVLIVDDVLATGGTAAAAVRLMQRLGARVVGIAVLVELEFLGGRGEVAALGHEVVSLIRFP
jgi:adenine phosphoribosyltransferase